MCPLRPCPQITAALFEEGLAEVAADLLADLPDCRPRNRSIANADPVGCDRVGENIVCVAGIGAGETLTGTDNANVITITGGPVDGTVNALGGNDTIIITGAAGLNGTTGTPGANGTAGTNGVAGVDNGGVCSC
jgi:hypothetical protein